MLDAKRLLDQFMGGQRSGGAQGAGGLGGLLGGGAGKGAVAGGLAGLLLGSKTGRKIGGSALRVGGMALVGALAYKAFQNWQAGRAAEASASGTASAAQIEPAPTGTPFNPASEPEQQSLGRSLMRAMIAAAKADGHVDAQEQSRIFAEIDRLSLESDDKAFVMDELRAPLDVGAVADGARSPEQAAEIYAASLLAIDVDNPAERGYLAMLAGRLNLDDELVKHIHASVDTAAPRA